MPTPQRASPGDSKRAGTIQGFQDRVSGPPPPMFSGLGTRQLHVNRDFNRDLATFLTFFLFFYGSVWIFALLFFHLSAGATLIDPCLCFTSLVAKREKQRLETL